MWRILHVREGGGGSEDRCEEGSLQGLTEGWKKSPWQGRSQMLPTWGEVKSCCLLNVKAHHSHESSELMGNIQLMTS